MVSPTSASPAPSPISSPYLDAAGEAFEEQGLSQMVRSETLVRD